MTIRRTLSLPLDDLLVVREFLDPAASRSGLARYVKRHGVRQCSVDNKDAPIAHKASKDYAPGFVHVDIKYLSQISDETIRRYLSVAIDRATRWVYVRIYADQSETSSTDFARRLQAAPPIKIEKLLTDNGSQFAGWSAGEHKKPSSQRAFDSECALLGIEHRFSVHTIRISDVLATKRLRPREDLRTAIERYVELYNNHLPKKALGYKTLRCERGLRSGRICLLGGE